MLTETGKSIHLLTPKESRIGISGTMTSTSPLRYAKTEAQDEDIAVCDLRDSISKVKLFKSIVGGNSSISLDLAASFDFPQKDEKISCIYELLL